MIKTEFIELYEKLNELWGSTALQESSHISKLEKAYKANPDELCNINSLRALANTEKFGFLSDETFKPYFEYLEKIFNRNGECRYMITDEIRNSSQKPEAHHIVFRSLGGSDEASNLIALFRDEHIKAHQLFAEGVLNYFNKAASDRNFLEKVLANAIGSVNILTKHDEQGKISKEALMQRLTELLSSAIRNEEDLDYDSDEIEGIIAKINSLNKRHMKAAVSRENNGGTANLRPPKESTYIVSFLDGTSVTTTGVKGVIEVIKEHNIKSTEFKSTITKDQVKDRTTAPNKEIPDATEEELFTDFGLVPKTGIYRVTAIPESHESKPIVYFPVLKTEGDTLVIDYSNGKWAKSPNTLRRLKIGLPDKAYQRLDKIHTDLRNKISPYRIFKSKKSGDNKDRKNYIFIYAEDIKLLQEVIDIENKKRTKEDQIIIRVTNNGQPWYINRQIIEPENNK